MGKRNSNNVKSLSDLILRTAKEDLMANAEILGFNQQGEMEKMKTYEMRKYLAMQVLANPLQVLNHLSYEDLMLFQQFVDAGPGMSVVYVSNGAVPPCVMLDLIDSHHDIKEGKVFYTMTDDLREAVSPLIDKVFDEFENKFRFYIESLVIGALNIYGCLTERQLKSLLKEYLDLEDDGTGTLEFIYPKSAAIQLCRFGFDDEFDEPIYASPFVFSIDEILASREEHPEIKDLKHFDKELVREAGGMPTPDIPNPKSREMERLLETKAGFTEQEAILTLFYIWQLMQHEENVTDTIQHLLDTDNRLLSVLPQLSDFMNHCPRWEFSGYCPNDLFRMSGGLSGKPHISMGPNMRKAGYKEEDLQRLLDDVWDNNYGDKDDNDAFMPHVGFLKVGRNDPCPCGSGKKYKNCCGRAN